jgi:hypothetical protein
VKHLVTNDQWFREVGLGNFPDDLRYPEIVAHKGRAEFKIEINRIALQEDIRRVRWEGHPEVVVGPRGEGAAVVAPV